MARILTAIKNFFKAETTTYSHRNRTVEMIASEKDIDINSIKNDTKAILENEGSVEAIIKLRRRFHVPLNTAWRFVHKLDQENNNQGSRVKPFNVRK
jgi:hypothetical protein